MINYLISILGLVLLCACWVLFQLWLRKQDPLGQDREIKCGGCGARCSQDDAAERPLQVD